MSAFWISIIRDHYDPLTARNLRASFMAGAQSCGITIMTDEPAHNQFKFRVDFNGDYDGLCSATQAAAGAQSSIVSQWSEPACRDHPTVLLR